MVKMRVTSFHLFFCFVPLKTHQPHSAAEDAVFHCYTLKEYIIKLFLRAVRACATAAILAHRHSN